MTASKDRERLASPAYTPRMAPLGALSQAMVTADACLPRGWEIVGLFRFGRDWVALAEDDTGEHVDALGAHAAQVLANLADALRERRGSVTG